MPKQSRQVQFITNLHSQVRSARLNQNTQQHKMMVIPELTGKGFGLGIWYGILCVGIHVLITWGQTGSIPHIFVAENVELFSYALLTLTVYGFACGVGAALWEHFYPSRLTIIANDDDSHHKDKNVPRRLFNIAVVTLKVVPSVMHLLKANAHLGDNNGTVSINLQEAEGLLDSMRGAPYTRSGVDVEAANGQVFLDDRSVFQNYGTATADDLDSSKNKQVTLWPLLRMGTSFASDAGYAAEKDSEHNKVCDFEGCSYRL